jgi:hypothetical protein
MPVPYTFGSLSGDVPAAYLDANFAAAALAADLTALTVIVAALPSNTLPLTPLAGGSAGVSAALSRVDHRHPPQGAVINLQTGTSYTIQASDNGKVVELSNAAAIALTVPNTLPQEFNCLITQAGAGQVTIAAQGGGTQRQRAGDDKTAGQWAVVSLYVRANSGGSAAEYVLAGDMTT